MEFNLDSMRVPLDSPNPKIDVNLSDDITLENLIHILETNRVYVPKGGYHAYMRSPEWKTKSAAMRMYFKTCAVCDSSLKLCVHHKHYESVGYEKLQDLTVLCGEHHWEYEKKRIEEKQRNKEESKVKETE